MLVAVLVLGATVLSVISWYNTGYHVVGRELRVHEGLLWRRTRAIPLERLQAVEVVRPLLAQLTGLAELRLEVVGGGKTEAPLAYLGGGRGGGAARPAAQPGRPGARRPTTAAADGGAPTVEPPAPAGRAAARRRQPGAAGQPVPHPAGVPAADRRGLVVAQFLSEGSWSFIAVASTLTAMAGVMLQPIRRVLDDWNFRLARDEARLRVHHGLLETRAQTVPLDRVQAVAVTWPLLWRVKGGCGCGWRWPATPAGDPDGRNSPDRLLPVGDLATARMVIVEVLPGVGRRGAAARRRRGGPAGCIR